MSPAAKLEDYHFILDHLLSSLKRACSSLDGFLYDFEMENGETVQRKLHFRIIFIIGDTKGADAWVGRFGSHWNTKCLSRDCDIETIHSDKPDKDCKFLRFTNMEKMSEDELKSLSMRRIKNSAFRSPPNMFGSSPYGICAATPPESLHVHLLGLCVRLFQYLYEQLTADQKRELPIWIHRKDAGMTIQIFLSFARAISIRDICQDRSIIQDCSSCTLRSSRLMLFPTS